MEIQQKSYSVKAKIFGLSGLLIFIMITSLGYITFEIRRSIDYVKAQKQASESAIAINQVRTQFLIIQYWYNEFALSWQIESQQTAEAEKIKFDEALNKLANIDAEFAKNAKTQGDSFSKLMISAAEFYVEGNRIAGTKSNSEAREIGSKLSAELTDRFDDFNKESAASADKVIAQSGYLSIVSVFSIFIGFLLSTVISSLVATNLSRQLRRVTDDIAHSGDKVETASQRMKSISGALSESANTTAEFLEEASASIEELTVILNQNEQNLKQVSALSLASFQSAESGEKQFKDLILSMAEISESAKKIVGIINVIDEIAYQTNLLALNAAVEAARAGEQGKGFAVVADAVQMLAQRSASAASEITTLIKDSVKKIDRGSAIAADGKTALQSIVSSAKTVADLNKDIASTGHEQSIGIAKISETVNKVDGLSQANAKEAKFVAGSSDELTNEAYSLQLSVNKMKFIIEGNVLAGSVQNETQFVD